MHPVSPLPPPFLRAHPHTALIAAAQDVDWHGAVDRVAPSIRTRSSAPVTVWPSTERTRSPVNSPAWSAGLSVSTAVIIAAVAWPRPRRKAMRRGTRCAGADADIARRIGPCSHDLASTKSAVLAANREADAYARPG